MLLQITERVEQRKKMKSQSKEIAAAASSMTSQPNYVPPESEDKQSTDGRFSKLNIVLFGLLFRSICPYIHRVA